MKKFMEAYETVKMPQACEDRIRAAMAEKRSCGRICGRLHPVLAALAVVVLMLSMSTEVRAEVKEIVENCSGTSFFSSLRTRRVRRKGNRSDSDGKRWGIITADKLNVRNKGSYDGKIVASLHYGDRIEILEESNGWLSIQDGWVSKEYVYEEGTIGARPGAGTIMGNQVNIRSGPGTDYPSEGTLSFGDQVDILEQIRYDNTAWCFAENGWICMDYVVLDE